jgi:hypothetical protein
MPSERDQDRLTYLQDVFEGSNDIVTARKCSSSFCQRIDSNGAENRLFHSIKANIAPILNISSQLASTTSRNDTSSLRLTARNSHAFRNGSRDPGPNRFDWGYGSCMKREYETWTQLPLERSGACGQDIQSFLSRPRRGCDREISSELVGRYRPRVALHGQIGREYVNTGELVMLS